MLSNSDWLRMQADAAAVRLDRSFEIAFRRGDVTLAAQAVRVEGVNRAAYTLTSQAAREARSAVVLFGAMDLDVQVEDRFTLDGVLYRVVFVAVNRDVDTQAEAVAVE